ncbi:MAG: alpha/beta hydrolase [Bacteroidetes bacterium]|nr:MAG: alpha/beta hydrolase [Bacteroidota bacterium]
MKKANCLLIVVMLIVNHPGQSQSCSTGKLDPAVAGFLKRLPVDNRSLEELKKTINLEEYRKIGPPAIPFPATDVMRMKITKDSIPVSVFIPSHEKGLPIIIYYHPGGFISPLTAGMEYLAWKDAKTYNAVVFTIDYGVAPERKFPAGLNDCYDSFKWISEHGIEFGCDTSRIALLGVSAGANLVAAVCQKAKKEGIAQKIKLQIMNCPVVDNPANAGLYPSMQQNADGYMLTKAGVLFALETYADEKDHNNPAYAPILSKDLSDLPPAVIITAEFDPLRDQGAAYADQLKKAGVKVWYQCFGGEIHCLIAAAENGLAVQALQHIVSTAMNEVMASKMK